MIDKLNELLETLEIDLGYMVYNGQSNNYIIFSVFNEKDIELFDDKKNATLYYITINHWFDRNQIQLFRKYKEIKKLLKNNGFNFLNSHDLTEGEMIGKSLDFTFKEWEL